MVCCSWEGGGVSLPVVTLSNDVLCTAPSTHPLHHSTMHNAQNVLKCTFLYPPTVAAQPPHCHESKVFTMQPTQVGAHNFDAHTRKARALYFHPAAPCCIPPLQFSSLVHHYFSASNVESASLLVSLLVCAGPGQEGEQILRYLCRRNMHNTTHRHTWLNNMCMHTHTQISVLAHRNVHNTHSSTTCTQNRNTRPNKQQETRKLSQTAPMSKYSKKQPQSTPPTS